jgi:hypothetical protein
MSQKSSSGPTASAVKPRQPIQAAADTADISEQSDRAATAPNPVMQQNSGDTPKSAPAAQRSAKKSKKIRDSYSMPEAEYAALTELKKKCLVAGIKVKRSELLRAGLHLLQALPTAQLNAVAAAVQTVKSGSGKKKKQAKKRTRH